MKKPAAPTTKFTFQSGDIQIKLSYLKNLSLIIFTFQSGDIQILEKTK